MRGTFRGALRLLGSGIELYSEPSNQDQKQHSLKCARAEAEANLKPLVYLYITTKFSTVTESYTV